MKYLFDLTTSARWSGAAVGILRVERELARRASARLGDQLRFCLHHRGENAFYVIPDDLAADIIAGRRTVHIGDAPMLQPLTEAAPPAVRTLRRKIRDRIIRSPRLYQSLQRLRGKSFSLAQIEAVRVEEARAALADPAPAPPTELYLKQVASHPATLTRDTVVISGGLDWETRDIRALYRLKQAKGFRYVPIVYDLIPLLYPQFVVPAYVNLLADYFGELFWLADACLCISRSTRADMIRYCHDQGIPAPPSGWFHLGCDLHDQPDETRRLPAALVGKRYAMMVSTIEPRKNHRTLYLAWDYCLRHRLVDAETCRLVFVGHQGWNVTELMHEVAANPRTKDTIVVTGSVDDETLELLYAHAEFGVFPSFYEGYGLPVAELLGHGKPTISSSEGSLKEVGKDFVTYKDPLDVIGWAEAIAAYFTDAPLLAAYAEDIRTRHRPVTWSKAADRFFDQLEALTNPTVSSPPA